MLVRRSNFIFFVASVGLLLLFSGMTLAQEPPSECVATGALAYDNWTKLDSGGTGELPAGVESKDYIRCKACHGWDRRGTDGGYVRRSRRDDRPNAGAGDGDSTPRAIVSGAVTADQISHAGTGRSYEQGMGSWVALDESHSAANTAAHASGYTLGNQHPDFTGGGITQAQVDCLVEFLNFADGDPAMYFNEINPSQFPVLYTLVDSADPLTGETYFTNTCEACHELSWVLDYLTGDGKFSELAHKARWGSPDSSMTRENMGDPTSQDIADLLAFFQESGGTGFSMNPGLTGTWWNATRAGEGFLLEVGSDDNGPFFFASFYSYDNMGRQIYLFSQGPITGGTSVDVTVWITQGRMWGAGFNPDDGSTTQWGTATFTFLSCGSGNISLVPDETHMGMGFTPLAYDITRDLITSGIECPTPAG